MMVLLFTISLILFLVAGVILSLAICIDKLTSTNEEISNENSLNIFEENFYFYE